MREGDCHPAETVGRPGATDEELFRRVVEIVQGARGRAARAVNSALVQAYWAIGREIVLVEQAGDPRAGYGQQLLARLSERMTPPFGRGFSVTNLTRMRQFYLLYPGGSLPAQPTDERVECRDQRIRSAVLNESGNAPQQQFLTSITWVQHLLLMGVKDPAARSFYAHEAANAGWSSRELERQIASLLYERLASSQDKDGVRALARRGQLIATPQGVIRDPVVLEFLGLPERPRWRERDLEQAIIDHLQEFLLELGRGFCFVARQQRITLNDDHFFVDLVLYNRLLRCFVVIDLKLGKLTHRDLGQLQMYVNWFDRTQRAEHEMHTIGIALCSRKNDAMVRMSLPEAENRILAVRYETVLPTPREFEAAITAGRRAAEQRQ